jgi:uncharacterized protein YdeI (YjbR/CyaY-like superfamily)
VKVPYAKKWQQEVDKLRKIALDCDIHLSQRSYGYAAGSEELLQRSHRVEKSGKKVTRKKASEYAVPEELQATLDAAPRLRAEKCVPMILSGRGFNERTD